MAEISEIQQTKTNDIHKEIQEHARRNSYIKDYNRLPENQKLELARKNEDHELVALLEKKRTSEKRSERFKTLARSKVAAVATLGVGT